MSESLTSEPMTIQNARKIAIQTAADWAAGADCDQFWGQDLADAAFGNSELSTILARAQREIAARIRRIRNV